MLDGVVKAMCIRQLEKTLNPFGRLVMKSQSRLVLAASIAVGLGLAPAPEAVAADDAMMELIEILYQKGSIDQAEYEALMEAASEEAETAEAGQAPTIKTAGGLTITAPDKTSEWDISGRVQVDAGFFGDETDENGNEVPLPDFGHELRRVWLSLNGKLWGDWSMKLQYAFESENVQDAWLAYKGLPGKTTLKIGRFKEPFSISQATGNGNLTFLERPSPVNGLAPFRNTGIQLGTQFGDVATLTAGIFGEGSDAGGDGVSASYGFTGRGTFAPIRSGGTVLHFGSAFTIRDAGESERVRFRDRFESRITNVRLVDTGTLTDVDGFSKFNLESAFVSNRLALQGEYLRASVDRSNAAGGDADFDGFYLTGSFFLTPDTRPYNFGGGKFGGIKPSNPLSQGGTGAWQVAFRYSDLNLADGSVDGGDQQIMTAGLNWYPDRNLRFSVNYNRVVGHDGGNFPGAEPAALTARAQVTW
jgi:phosphate-selective porin OprO/OprP